MNFLMNVKLSLIHTYRDKMTLFWNTIFPIMLASFFILVFSTINKEPGKIDIAMEKNNPYIEIAEEIPYLNLKEVKSDITTDLKNKEYKVFVHNDLTLEISNSSVDVMIVKNIFDQIKQISNTELDKNEIVKNLKTNFIETTEQRNTNAETMLYSIIIMTSFYTVFDGVIYVDNILYSSSERAKRLLASPLKRSSYLFSSILSGLLISGANVVILIIFLKLVFNITIITNILASAVIISSIMILGLTLGMVLSLTLKLKVTAKTGIGLGIVLFMCYTSGMLGPGFTNLLSEKFPIIANLNPATNLQNAFVSSNMIGYNGYLIPAVGYSLLLSFVFLIFSIFKLRRAKQYDF